VSPDDIYNVLRDGSPEARLDAVVLLKKQVQTSNGIEWSRCRGNMSDRTMWKMLHLLYRCGKPGIAEPDLIRAGVDCWPDTISILMDSGAVIRQATNPPEFMLSPPAMNLLQACLVCNKLAATTEIEVDYPRSFVIMPFSEPWSDEVYSRMIEPAAISAGLDCVRGDTLVRVGDLTSNIWQEILKTGVVIADVSAPNVNVFYELGLVHAIGKDTLLLKRNDSVLPADFGGAHFYEYSLNDLDTGRIKLTKALSDWASIRRAIEVKSLYGR
jgi:hypothetical protein